MNRFKMFVIVLLILSVSNGIFAQDEEEGRGYLGMVPGKLSDADKKKLGFDGDSSVICAGICDGSAAQKGGMLDDDIVTKMDDTEISEPGDIMGFMGETKPDQEVTVVVMRKNDKGKLAEKKLKVKLDKSPASNKSLAKAQMRYSLMKTFNSESFGKYKTDMKKLFGDLLKKAGKDPDKEQKLIDQAMKDLDKAMEDLRNKQLEEQLSKIPNQEEEEEKEEEKDEEEKKDKDDKDDKKD